MSNRTVDYFISIVKNSKELTKKEKEILTKRLKNKTLEKIGKKYKVTAERVRQIEEKALIKFIAKICQLNLFD
ncbi:MAG: hypothetical protein A3H79_00050 [Candidatus Levybacteria bacterium RIFCSPLOWO2_02_FULL_36_8b]|nr:MAG: hypothetical protein A3H79_00050 [Candidatus Levybacteria bacterium RIFCSPLOWO2_02_FULL_36_8b]